MKQRVVVLYGGRSGEHEVSVNSAASVLAALDRDKYEAIPVLITREGRWLAGVAPAQAQKEPAPGAAPGPADDYGGFPAAILADPTRRGLTALGAAGVRADVTPVDVVIPVLHGPYGEDGTVQGLLELAGVPYVGAGVLGAALGMDKVLMKTVLARHGAPQVRFWSCLRRHWEENSPAVLAAVEKSPGYPCFVKPANLGSSVGISSARHREELVRALDLAARYDRKLIVEEAVDAREVEVSVLGNDAPVASLPGEIIPLREFYDYEAKYVDGKSRLVIPADLPPAAVARLQELAVQVFKALDCAGLARVDFFLRRSDGAVLVNEINTMPGFTRFSMYPKLWEATGIPYGELLDRLIALALERHREKNRTQITWTLPER